MSERAAIGVSLSMQATAKMISDRLAAAAGEPVAFVLICSVNDTAQYVSNASREDGMEMMRTLFERWAANRADIPAHYNPDL